MNLLEGSIQFMLENYSDMGRFFWIAASGKVYNVEGKSSVDHLEFLAVAPKKVLFNDFGLSQKDLDILKELQEVGEYTDKAEAINNRILKNGNIRIRIFKNELDIDSAYIVKPVALQVFDLIQDRNIKIEKVVWEDLKGTSIELTWDEFKERYT